MRLLVGLHHLELGGSQLNALDFALTMREHGHDVAVFGVHTGVPGPMAEMVRSAGLPLSLVRHPVERHRAVVPYRRAVSRGLTAAAKAHRADLVHVYEFPLALDAFDGPHLRLGLPVVVTIYGMAVPRWLPRYPELIVGTQELVDEAAAFRARPTLIEPPVNTDADDVTAVDGQAFRDTLGIRDDELLLGVVSRLEPDMKAEGILRAMAALSRLDDERLRLVVVGTGPSAGELRAEAAKVNEALGRPAVLLPGALEDPRPAYAAMDIALGMGGSALRAMSFGHPLVVLGIEGFSRECTPETLDHFLSAGFWGIGDGDLDAGPLAEQIRVLAADPTLRGRLGGWSRRLVLERFSLKAAADKLAEVYARALAQHQPPTRRIGEAARVAAHKAAADMMPESVRQRLRRAR
ncbi:glycosyltransferase family 4 protein [Phytohabitans sp. LJ34]|uniref:glycosyltransferase family 4 protein n=1 Tax=Phytohabitans sp. LJ34 TaxID=3452217 RepID=UPI003F891FDE